MKQNSHIIPSVVKDQRLIAQRRQQIVEGAVRLFIQKGFHKTTTREIAKECGLSIGTMYEYIQTKEDVLYLVCEYIHTQLEQRLRESVSDSDSARESLKKSVKNLFDTVNEMSSLIVLIYQETKSLPKDLMSYVLQKEEEITRIFEKILLRGMEDGTLSVDADSVKLMAHNIMVIGQMWAFRRWALSRYYDIEEYTKRQMSLIFEKLIPRGDEDGNRSASS
ncbi:TetR/AcrR family transcriptional regulator [Thermoflavimicrobium dichotomicum]|uniref:DNA-binding transcriptional regulator, AcrR family n=1 Tax=Thermoflavimicrobium dichotomicum TaxID=46223 RepID=A0A1I3K5S5_9BACL|nr:TetR/AcrR family transcriptional regulator [Thermoflavimicrobium dichotomicum]SFI67774.1 DNA-binding transcriptional regulator, AcrR family [Thermoflavimicrobium dichotomicum]